MLWSFNFWLYAEYIRITILRWWSTAARALFAFWHNVSPIFGSSNKCKFRLLTSLSGGKV